MITNLLLKIKNTGRRHYRRWLKFSILGCILTAISFGVLYLQVHSGVQPTFAYLFENVFMLQLGFALNRYITFGDRGAPFWSSLLKWNAFKSITFGLSQVLYFVLIHVAGEQYLLASLTVALCFGMLDYAISNIWAFAKKSH
ncbi:MAG TPA: GtrA family protein [Candidatus Saccharimonadales bacterium]|nr:GtrA family protein [Candidatus Saccharimonadales bacterium]